MFNCEGTADAFPIELTMLSTPGQSVNKYPPPPGHSNLTACAKKGGVLFGVLQHPLPPGLNRSFREAYSLWTLGKILIE